MANKTNNLAEKTRKDFPIFTSISKSENNLIYLDHAATSQKPLQVIKSLEKYYSFQNANVHRGAHQLSAIATEKFEESREIIANFINADSSKEIVFTRNATEAINLVANSWGKIGLKEGDEVLLTVMEHHSNIVPWQIIAKEKNIKIRYIGITPNGELDINDFKEKLNEKTRLVSLTHISNVLGTCNPIREIANLAHTSGALVLLDACQSLAHLAIDIKALKVDFLAGSSHKVCGPTGVGFLWARESLLEEMPPFLGGGEMIEEVSLEYSKWAVLPHKFEAGTPAIGEAIGFGSALQYLNQIGLENIKTYEFELTKYLFKLLKSVPQIKLLGPEPKTQSHRGSLATFVIQDLHSNDISALLDQNDICIRSGHHCCQPLHSYLQINSSARASISFTTTYDELNIFYEALISNIDFLKKHS